MTTISDAEQMRRFYLQFAELVEEVTKLRLAMEALRRTENNSSSDWYFNH